MSIEQIATATIEDAHRRVKELRSLAEQTGDARKALFDSLAGIGAAVEDFRPLAAQYITELRQFRFAAIAEISNGLSPLADLRKFFLSENHDSEIKRLREFVELCERLRELKESGFLDKVADTMLKLEKV